MTLTTTTTKISLLLLPLCFRLDFCAAIVGTPMLLRDQQQQQEVIHRKLVVTATDEEICQFLASDYSKIHIDRLGYDEDITNDDICTCVHQYAGGGPDQTTTTFVVECIGYCKICLEEIAACATFSYKYILKPIPFGFECNLISTAEGRACFYYVLAEDEVSGTYSGNREGSFVYRRIYDEDGYVKDDEGCHLSFNDISCISCGPAYPGAFLSNIMFDCSNVPSELVGSTGYDGRIDLNIPINDPFAALNEEIFSNDLCLYIPDKQQQENRQQQNGPTSGKQEGEVHRPIYEKSSANYNEQTILMLFLYCLFAFLVLTE